MVSTTIKYIVYTHDGGGVRHHHFGVQNNIIDEADGHASTGDTIPALGFPSQEWHGQLVPFAFMTVNGGVGGNQLYTSPGNHTVTVGTDNVDILVVYAPPGGIGGPGGQPGIWVDAFNVDSGNFSDSLDFIKVLTPPTPPDTVDAAKTTFGNQDGTVVTLTAENVRANDHVDGVPFLEWKRITQSPLIQSSREIDCAVGQTGEIWFAFYKTPPPPKVSIPNVKQMIEAGIMIWTGDDYCGNGGIRIPIHGPGPSPFKISLSKGVLERLNPDQQKKMQGFMKAYPDAAQAAHVAMTNVTNILGGISGIIGNKQH